MHRPDTALPLETVEEMYRSYAERQSVMGVAAACGVSAGTASKYIEKGDPSRGIEPFRKRWARVLRRAQAQEDDKLASIRAKASVVAESLLGLMGAKVQQLQEKRRANPKGVVEVPTRDLPGGVDRMARLLLVLNDAPDSIAETRAAESEPGPGSLEELREVFRLLPPGEKAALLLELTSGEGLPVKGGNGKGGNGLGHHGESGGTGESDA